MKWNTITLAGTATLSALVVVLDYALKYANLKIQLPLLPYKFDFTGIPIVISALLFGLLPGILTSTVAFVAILVRSGDLIGSSMKGLAELSTILGMVAGFRLFGKLRTAISVPIGLASRVLIMTIVNLAFLYAGLLLLPSLYEDALMIWILIVGAFNLAQGAVSAVGGYLIFEMMRRRVPSLIERERTLSV